MVKMIMHGCNGAMGRVITGLVQEDGAIEIVAGICVFRGPGQGFSGFLFPVGSGLGGGWVGGGRK